MQKLNAVIAALLAVAAVGCARMQETPLAPNMVRLDASAPWAPGGTDATVREAAEITLRSGYDAFRLTPVYALAFNNFGVTVVMFRAGDPAARDAINAADVLQRRAF
jgi:hypothetical protein